jgi:uncharacterized phage infection (PIP) family protein YhgE
MTEPVRPSQIDPYAFRAGVADEFMRNTRRDLGDLKASVSQLSRTQTKLSESMLSHSNQASQTAQDVGEIKAAMSEMHACIENMSKSSSAGKHKVKHMVTGAVLGLFGLSVIVMAVAGKDGDLLATLTRVLSLII